MRPWLLRSGSTSMAVRPAGRCCSSDDPHNLALPTVTLEKFNWSQGHPAHPCRQENGERMAGKQAARLDCAGSGGLPRSPARSPLRHLGGGTRRRPATNLGRQGKQGQPPLLMLLMLMYYSRRVGQQERGTRKGTKQGSAQRSSARHRRQQVKASRQRCPHLASRLRAWPGCPARAAR